MESFSIPISDWDGQLPAYVAKNERIWWEVFPSIKADLPPKILQIFGGVRESPTRETVGKVILVSETRAELRAKFGAAGGSLLNHWGCFCNKMMDGLETGYMAGTATTPMLTFNVFGGVMALVILRFYRTIETNPSLIKDLQKIEETQMEMVKASGNEMQLQEIKIGVISFKHGNWEDGLETAFRAALWVCSNREKALKNIWKIHL